MKKVSEETCDRVRRMVHKTANSGWQYDYLAKANVAFLASPHMAAHPESIQQEMGVPQGTYRRANPKPESRQARRKRMGRAAYAIEAYHCDMVNQFGSKYRFDREWVEADGPRV